MKRRAPALGLALAGCSGIQSAADPAGDHAAITDGLFQLFLSITGFFFLLVLLFLGWAVLRRNRSSAREGRLNLAVTVWAGMITLGLTVLTIGSFFADRHLAFAAASRQPPLQLKITAQQWWWQVEYQDPIAGNQFTTANVIHLPAGRPVSVTLMAEDVIHSFWVPNLAGKQDLIPGRSTDIRLLPRRVGHFRAQCAEFCGLQHAHMALDVIVEPEADFAAWRARSLAPAPAPRTPLQQAGYDVFMSRQCSACHAISGTPAHGTIGPDLSRVASRASLAAGTLPNRRGWLEAWIADPQTMKPGNKMPSIDLSPVELHALTTYLESLS